MNQEVNRSERDGKPIEEPDSPALDVDSALLLGFLPSDGTIVVGGDASTEVVGSGTDHHSTRGSTMADERIEKLAREAATGAPTERAAQLMYEWRKRSLERQRELYSRDRRLVAARIARLTSGSAT